MHSIPKSILADPEEAVTREWLVTNGTGGYASSTIPGANTRRYHGLLVASFPPPLGRQVVLSKVDEEVEVGGETHPLGCNEYQDGTIHPEGFRYLASFELDLGIPTAEYRVSETHLRKQTWMEHGRNTVYLLYTLLSAPGPVVLRIRPFCAFRGYHGPLRDGMHAAFPIKRAKSGVSVSSGDAAYTLRLVSPGARFHEDADWYWAHLYRAERDRGFDHREDLFTPGLFSATLSPGEQLILAATCESWLTDIDGAFEREMERRRSLVEGVSDDFRRQLLLAADQFVVSLPGPKLRKAVIAGYHWFTDWGRDTMIGLPGLLLSTGRFEEAREILLECAGCLDQGMLPNRFADDGQADYNTADATLWFFEALHKYTVASGDCQIIRRLFPRLREVIRHHVEGTRFGIKMDHDGLLNIGQRKSQLTWMDACVNGCPVTPRSGKPVEINALWYNALSLMASWARYVGKSADEYDSLATLCVASFRREFWYEAGDYLYDVVDAPGRDASLRPNQIMAVSLTHSPLDSHQQRAVVDTVERELLTPYGLRTLSPENPSYSGLYQGGPDERDSVYHQGTAWPWLLGQFADAHYRVYHDRDYLAGLLKPFEEHLAHAGIGSISELFDGDSPHRPGGCIAQAWSVAEVLRVLTDLRTLG